MIKFYYLGIALLFFFYALPMKNSPVNWIGIPKSGTISGQVMSIVDERPIEGATIIVKKNDGSSAAVTKTDENGFFKVPGLAAHQYNVIAENQEFGRLVISKVPVAVGSEVTTHFILTPIEFYY
jgi:hypothetical protein